MSEAKYYKGIDICCENCKFLKRNCIYENGRCYEKFKPSDKAYNARIDELEAFVRKVADSEIPSVKFGTENEIMLIKEARTLLRGEGK